MLPAPEMTPAEDCVMLPPLVLKVTGWPLAVITLPVKVSVPASASIVPPPVPPIVIERLVESDVLLLVSINDAADALPKEIVPDVAAPIELFAL